MYNADIRHLTSAIWCLTSQINHISDIWHQTSYICHTSDVWHQIWVLVTSDVWQQTSDIRQTSYMRCWLQTLDQTYDFLHEISADIRRIITSPIRRLISNHIHISEIRCLTRHYTYIRQQALYIWNQTSDITHQTSVFISSDVWHLISNVWC